MNSIVKEQKIRTTQDDTIHNKQFKENELSAKQENTKNRKTLFYSILGSSASLMIVAILSALFTLHKGGATTQEVAILAMLMTAPIILSLALMRYIFDGKKTDTPQPTLMLNIGKEFATVLSSIFKK